MKSEMDRQPNHAIDIHAWKEEAAADIAGGIDEEDRVMLRCRLCHIVADSSVDFQFACQQCGMRGVWDECEMTVLPRHLGNCCSMECLAELSA